MSGSFDEDYLAKLSRNRRGFGTARVNHDARRILLSTLVAAHEGDNIRANVQLKLMTTFVDWNWRPRWYNNGL